MGYESKVIIARKYGTKKYACTEIIAQINLCGMPNGFDELFTKEYPNGYYVLETAEKITTDKYDAPVTYAKLDTVLKWALDNALEARYRRMDLLIATLTSVRQGWGNDKDLIVIHYGY